MRRFFAVTMLAVALAHAPAGAAVITIVNGDTLGEGFNDATAVAPIGGNPGVTLGQQRLNVFQQAASVWAAILPSAVTIRVLATFDPQTCTMTSATLGSAGTQQVFRDFAGSEWAGTWYHGALANRLNGSDLSASDDIRARFNKDVDNGTCLGSTNWYYGFDGNEGTNVDLFPVVLHELGHGLGFSTVQSLSTGVMLGGFPDVYNRFIRDMVSGQLWPSLSDAGRQSAAVSTGNEVWDGTAANEQAWHTLQLRPELTVSSPPVIAGTYSAGAASYGPPAGAGNITAPLVLVNDGVSTTSDGCSALINGASVSGKIAVVDRGNCSFNIKAQTAQAAGAVGVLMVDNVAGSTAPQMGGVDPSITIPMVSVTQSVGNSIKAQLGGGVNATIRANPYRLVGAHDTGRLLLYAPNPLQSGSSISHFDVSAVPNLLMEPAINTDLSVSDVDLTREVFEDIGWFIPRTTGAPVTFSGGSGLESVPNPFNDRTSLRFALRTSGVTEVSLFDISGRLVTRLAHRWLPAGANELSWNGLDGSGRPAKAGVYLATVRNGLERYSQRVVLVD